MERLTIKEKKGGKRRDIEIGFGIYVDLYIKPERICSTGNVSK